MLIVQYKLETFDAETAAALADFRKWLQTRAAQSKRDARGAALDAIEARIRAAKASSNGDDQPILLSPMRVTRLSLLAKIDRIGREIRAGFGVQNA